MILEHPDRYGNAYKIDFKTNKLITTKVPWYINTENKEQIAELMKKGWKPKKA